MIITKEVAFFSEILLIMKLIIEYIKYIHGLHH